MVYDDDELAAGTAINGRVHAAAELLAVVGKGSECELAGRHGSLLSSRQDTRMKDFCRDKLARRRSVKSLIWRGANETSECSARRWERIKVLRCQTRNGSSCRRSRRRKNAFC